jgi:uncharacterized membrane protein YfbV (UPF0208 family)
MSKKKPTLSELVEKWRTSLNSNAQAALGELDMRAMVELVSYWIEDVTGELREQGRPMAFVDPEQYRRLCDLIQVTMAELDKREER